MSIDENVQRQLVMAGQMASKRIAYILNRDFGFVEHKVLAGARLEADKTTLYMYAVTAGMFFRVTTNQDLTDVVVRLIPPSDKQKTDELKGFFGGLPESFTTVKPNTNRN
jgi:hypothetical protein